MTCHSIPLNDLFDWTSLMAAFVIASGKRAALDKLFAISAQNEGLAFTQVRTDREAPQQGQKQ